MLLNFDDVNDLKQLKESLEYYKEYLFEWWSNDENDREINQKLETNKKLIQKITKEIEYYEVNK